MPLISHSSRFTRPSPVFLLLTTILLCSRNDDQRDNDVFQECLGKQRLAHDSLSTSRDQYRAPSTHTFICIAHVSVVDVPIIVSLQHPHLRSFGHSSMANYIFSNVFYCCLGSDVVGNLLRLSSKLARLLVPSPLLYLSSLSCLLYVH
ncbi:hypothetical protein BD311DRAFT_754833 [Dichomitus squalens]|uniref:Secreted protein n=1 Tax=Dichomitus squalens TaxID=114155 RepID=A0A4Q9MUV9_9APHY|nr:hypothetical protein BD311DRAFT_754833 [Dichomitus squalens]